MGKLNACRRYATPLLLTVFLCACGGGGGGGGGPSGGGLSISPTDVGFTAQKNGPTPAPQVVVLTITASDAAFVGADASSFPSWLAVAFSNVSSTSADLIVSITTTNLSAGTYTHSFEVGIARQDQSIIATQVVSVTYTVTSKIAASPAALTFMQVVGSPGAAAQALDLSDNDGKSYAWDLTVSYQSGSGWLTLSAGNGASLPASVSVGVDPNLPPGTYNASILVSGNGESVNVPVTYTVRGASLAATATSVFFSAGNRQLTLPAATDVTLTTENGSFVGYSIDVTYGAGPSGWITPTGTSAPGVLTIAVNTVNLAAGTYSGTVKLTPDNGQPAVSILVTYTVHATTIGRGPGVASFTAVSGQSAPPAAINISVTTETDSRTPYAATVTYGTGASGWLSATSGTAPDTVSIVPSTTDIAPGTYFATVSLTPDSGAAPILIPVSYTLTAPAFSVGATSAAFDIDAASTATSPFLIRSILTASTGATLTWVASSPAPWLTVTPTGTTGDVLTLTLVPAELASLENGTSPATVTINYSTPYGGSGSELIAVSLNLKLPAIDHVAPYIVVPDSSDNVVLRGSGFDGAQGRPINFGSTSVLTYTVLNDNAIRVDAPALPAGTYLVQAQNDLGLSRTGARLVAKTTPSFAGTALPYTNSAAKEVTSLIYDAEREALFVGLNYPGARSSNEILRYAYGGAWATPTSNAVANLSDVALVIDGQTLAAAADKTLVHIDPQTFGTVATISFTKPLENLKQLAVSSDGDLFAATRLDPGFSGTSGAYRYNLQAGSFTGLVNLFQANIGASADGLRVVIGESGGVSSPVVAYFDTVTWSGHATGISLDTKSVVLNRDASRTILRSSVTDVSTVYDSTFTPLVSLPVTTLASLFSPDGGFIYTYDSAGTVRKFDATTALESGTGTVLTDSPGTDVKMAITPDGLTLFLAGSNQIVIVPAPP